MNSNSRINLFERDSHLLEKIQLDDYDLNTNSSQTVNDLISSILSPSISLSSLIDERSLMIGIAKEEAKVKNEIIHFIVFGNSNSLRANSYQAVMATAIMYAFESKKLDMMNECGSDMATLYSLRMSQNLGPNTFMEVIYNEKYNAKTRMAQGPEDGELRWLAGNCVFD